MSQVTQDDTSQRLPQSIAKLNSLGAPQSTTTTTSAGRMKHLKTFFIFAFVALAFFTLRSSVQLEVKIPGPSAASPVPSSSQGSPSVVPPQPMHTQPRHILTAPARSNISAPARSNIDPKRVTEPTSTVADAGIGLISCFTHENQRRLYFAHDTNECLLLPNGRATLTYNAPSDLTLIPLVDALKEEDSGSSASDVINTKNKVPAGDTALTDRRSPTSHCKWLFEDWRLWEGELKCPSKGGADEQSKNELTESITDFITIGRHNSEAINSVYQLDYFCVDEEAGSLVGFEVADAAGAVTQKMNIAEHKGEHEHPHGGKWSSNERFFHDDNRVRVSLKAAGGNERLNWKSAATTSLGEHYGTPARPKNGNEVADVLFVDEPTLIVPLNAYENSNVAHQLHRYGSATILARLLNTNNLLFTIDLAAQKASDKLYVSAMYRQSINRIPTPFDLLPKYLLTSEEAANTTASTPNDIVENTIASPAINWNFREVGHLPNTQIRPRNDFVTPMLFARDAQGGLDKEMAFASLVGTLFSSGAEGCYDTRCSSKLDCSDTAKASRNRCTRRFAALLIGSLNAVDARVGRGAPASYLSDTQNYSKTVWNFAVKESFREAKRFRRDLHLAKTGAAFSSDIDIQRVLHPIKSDMYAKRYEYLSLWRGRLIDDIVHMLQSKENYEGLNRKEHMRSENEATADYTNEALTVFLELAHHREQALLQEQQQLMANGHINQSSPPNIKNLKLKKRPLMCYRKAYVSHVHANGRGNDHGTNAKGSFPQIFNPNCNSREAANAIYADGLARYGTCDAPVNAPPKKAEKMPDKDPIYSDAHPIFVLPETANERLRRAFRASREAIGGILQTALKVAPEKLDVAGLESEIAEAQLVYDTEIMKFFTATEDGQPNTKKTSPSVGRPIDLFWALRTIKRPTIHLSQHMTQILRDQNGMRRYISFEFAEGLHGSGGETKEASDQSSTKNRLTSTGRARQLHNYQSADIFMGPHGADMHGVVYTKPTAMITEIAYGQYDTGNMDLSGGYFSFLAYAREVGYLRVLGQSRFYNNMHPDAFDRPMVPVALAELRQTFSLTVCTWLAYNSVRLSDIAAARKNSSSNTSNDFSFLLPWWCRGGSSPIVREFLDHRSIVDDGAAWKRSNTKLTLDSEFFDYYKRRNVQTSIGFFVPHCPPLWSGLEINATASSVKLLPVRTSRDTLNRLQNECAKTITSDSFAHDSTGEARRDVEGLQGLLEDALPLIDTLSALQLARLMVEGSKKHGGFDSSKKDKSLCGVGALTRECLEKLLKVALSPSRAVAANFEGVSVVFLSLLPSAVPKINNEAVLKATAKWISDQFYWVVHEAPRTQDIPGITSNSFSYGHMKCPSP